MPDPLDIQQLIHSGKRKLICDYPNPEIKEKVITSSGRHAIRQWLGSLDFRGREERGEVIAVQIEIEGTSVSVRPSGFQWTVGDRRFEFAPKDYQTSDFVARNLSEIVAQTEMRLDERRQAKQIQRQERKERLEMVWGNAVRIILQKENVPQENEIPHDLFFATVRDEIRRWYQELNDRYPLALFKPATNDPKINVGNRYGAATYYLIDRDSYLNFNDPKFHAEWDDFFLHYFEVKNLFESAFSEAHRSALLAFLQSSVKECRIDPDQFEERSLLQSIRHTGASSMPQGEKL